MSVKKIERGLFELYDDDPIRADRVIFGRKTNPDRRGFLQGAGLAAMSALVGAAIPFHRNMPAGFIPAALAQQQGAIEGKDGLISLGDRPVNAETPAHLLDDPITPTAKHFIRNNGNLPETMDAKSWKLVIDGHVNKPLTLTIDDLRKQFEVVSAALLIECAGNGRGFFNPPAKGNQWTYGGVGCSKWKGVRLADVLKAAGVKEGAVYTGHEGADVHLSGDPKKKTISRGVPIKKAQDPNCLIAFEMNGAPIHPMNGAPLRLIIPGWIGSCSQKWLTRIWVRDVMHDGEKMKGKSYKVPKNPVAPGQDPDEKDFVILEALPVKSIITSPATGAKFDKRTFEVRGHAWSGYANVKELYVSYNYGATWETAKVDKPVNPGAWQNWRAQITVPRPGYYEIWAKAMDARGITQPHAVKWNPEGYVNNAMHRVAITVS